ncbi:hypothetical protein [Pantoea ananatis]|uniref:hypothetical protein n=1 Tax=Pantoea ananas TaxID=553 RepID=UPI0021E97ED2|nr:hypothetical protein [Pantoea ananatis]MCW1776885.1 hypothetical protein [Pantoea ananatis]UYK95451.1 hypothetical protein NG826_23060 [Pantoea ananatis]
MPDQFHRSKRFIAAALHAQLNANLQASTDGVVYGGGKLPAAGQKWGSFINPCWKQQS